MRHTSGLFSLESLLLLKRLYERRGLPQPMLICASLTAIPIQRLAFDLIWSTQVYQHIPHQADIVASISRLTGELLHLKGCFVIDNLNFGYHRHVLGVYNCLRPGRAKPISQTRETDHYYLKYFLPDDLKAWFAATPFRETTLRLAYSECLFHPEFRFRPRGALMARLDEWLSQRSWAPHLARQISVFFEKRHQADVSSPERSVPAAISGHPVTV